MTQPPTGTLLIISGDSTGEAHRQAGDLAQALESRLGHRVVPCVSQAAGQPVIAGIRTLVTFGVQRIVALPLDLSGAQDQGKAPAGIKWASRRWPFLTFHAAAPLGWQEWAFCLHEAALDALRGLGARPEESAALLAGAGCPDALTNANLARLAQLVREASPFARVEHAFLNSVRPGITEVGQMLVRLGVRHVVVVPWLLGNALADQVEQAARESDLRLTLAATPLTRPALVDILISRHQAALADDSFLAPSWSEIQAEIARTMGSSAHDPAQTVSAEEEAQLRELDRKINEMLPPQYQGSYEQVRSESMGTAPLQFGPDGKVAWNEIWTSFCDLALAGGPPHRGTLLEAVPAADALAEPEKYRAVVAEIERGIRLVTGLSVVPSRTPGWVGVRCDSEAMAVWLMRAIVVENVMVRREGEVIYLPAGPQFTLKREIKNVVTVLAKTCHYWTAHLQRQE